MSDQEEEYWLSADNLWPCSFEDLDQKLILRLDDKNFSILCKRFRARALRAGETKRSAEDLVREIKKLRNAKKDRIPKGMLLARYKASSLLSAIYPDRKPRWLWPTKRRQKEVLSIENFCFFDNPRETIDTLRSIVRHECTATSIDLLFDERPCSDIGPFLLLAMMSREMAPIVAGWGLSQPLKKALVCTKIYKDLKILSNMSAVDQTGVWGFPVRYRRKPGTTNSKHVELDVNTVTKVAENFVETLDQWLSKIEPGLKLTEQSEGDITKIIGEVLDNAERHSATEGDGDWAITGFMAKRRNDANGSYRFLCHIGFASSGLSFSDTMSNAEDSQITSDLKNYVDRHKSRQTNLGEEELRTVYALQDDVSRFASDQDGAVRGRGLMEFINLTNVLGQTGDNDFQPEIVVISGASYIKLSGPYKNGVPDSNGMFKQFFNDHNDMMIQPHPEHVLRLPTSIGGTLISCRFQIDGSAYEIDSEN